MTQVQSDLEIIKRAQEQDAELYRAIGDLEDIPEQREVLKAEFEAEKNRLKELETELKTKQLTQKEKEGQLAQKEANVKKLDGQLSQVKTNKEYSALQQEIASLKADNSVLEEEIIRFMDEIEAAKEEVQKEQERIKVCEKDHQAKGQKLNETEKAAKEIVERLKTQREEILKQLSPDVRTMYENFVKKHRGRALAPVEGNVCGNCKITLRAQIINEVLLGETLVVCDCNCFLYSDKKADA
ncbi:MAG: hypothetical protein H6757_06955 [Candidatus Omnitrophica bacterium]|nr:hypothetical protein [Candidatus Omnitrophota bacterium]